MKHTSHLLVILTVCALAPCQALASDPEPASPAAKAEQSDSVEDILQATGTARMRNAEQLRSAFGRGRIRYVVHDADQEQPVTVTDSDIQFFYSDEKFRLHLVHAARMLEMVKPREMPAEQFQRWVPSKVTEQVIIYDGKRVVSVETDADGQSKGTIFFGFAKLAVMRAAGFPFESPIAMAETALKPEELDAKKVTITPLDAGGYLGLLSKNTYRMKFYVLNRFPFDIRRVSSYRTGETQPFRDFLMSWDESNGVYYVQRYSNTVTSANRDTASSQHNTRRLAIEYEQFDVNIDISPEIFDISSLDIPLGTRFSDKRNNVNGGPTQLTFDGQQLVPVDP